MSVSLKINYLRPLLNGGDLREFDELSGQNNGTTNAHPKNIMEGLLGYFPDQCHIQSEARNAPRNA